MSNVDVYVRINNVIVDNHKRQLPRVSLICLDLWYLCTHKLNFFSSFNATFCTIGLFLGGYHYSLKMFTFEKVRARNFARAWGFVQFSQVTNSFIVSRLSSSSMVWYFFSPTVTANYIRSTFSGIFKCKIHGSSRLLYVLSMLNNRESYTVSGESSQEKYIEAQG